MDAEVVRQLRMVIGWVLMIRRDAGSCRIILWIVSYRLDRILSYRLYCIWKHRILCAGWLLPGWYGWDGWTGWGVGQTGVGRTDISNHQNGSATIGTGIGAPKLALEGQQDMGIDGCHQLRRCYKDVEYLCRKSKAIQI